PTFSVVSRANRAVLRDATLRVLQVAEVAGVTAILVHAISDEAKAYHLSKGFLKSPIQPMTLCLVLGTARQALAGNELHCWSSPQQLSARREPILQFGQVFPLVFEHPAHDLAGGSDRMASLDHFRALGVGEGAETGEFALLKMGGPGQQFV